MSGCLAIYRAIDRNHAAGPAIPIRGINSELPVRFDPNVYGLRATDPAQVPGPTPGSGADSDTAVPGNGDPGGFELAPTGQVGWFLFWRVGAAVQDPNAFRTLVQPGP